MAAVFSHHGTLSASTVDTVDLVDGAYPVLVTNRGIADIYVRFDGTDPTVGGDNTFIVPAGVTKQFQVTAPLGAADRTCKLISSSTPAYSVEIS